MIRKRKEKIKINDINKNVSPQISHSIKKIKANERKYTCILVIFFMFLFCIIGYFTLSVNSIVDNIANNDIPNDINLENTEQDINLTKEQIMSDKLGLESKEYTFNFENTTKKDINYKIVFVQDEEITNICGCEDRKVDPKYIKYSLNGKTVEKFSDDQMIIKRGIIKIGNTENTSIRIWLDESLTNSNIDYHYHGHFILEEE